MRSLLSGGFHSDKEKTKNVVELRAICSRLAGIRSARLVSFPRIQAGELLASWEPEPSVPPFPADGKVKKDRN